MATSNNEFSDREGANQKIISNSDDDLYCAHVIIWQRYKDDIQDDYGIWENIYLIKANTEDEAWQMAESEGIEFAREDDGLEINGRPARWVYGGVRKLISVIDSNFLQCKIYETMNNIVELTWNEFTVPDKASLDKLISGKSVNVNYDQ